MLWTPYFKDLWHKQELPPERKHVLVRIAGDEQGNAPGILMGYMKFAAGDKTSPRFIVPGVRSGAVITHWCDCLPESMQSRLIWNAAD